MPKLINGVPPRNIIARAASAGQSAFWSSTYKFMESSGYKYKYGDVTPSDEKKLEKAMIDAVEAFVTQNGDSLELKESMQVDEAVSPMQKRLDAIAKQLEGNKDWKVKAIQKDLDDVASRLKVADPNKDATLIKNLTARQAKLTTEIEPLLKRCKESTMHSIKSFDTFMEGSKEEYQKFFQAALKKFNVDSPSDFDSEDKKKEFFDYVDKNYKGE